MRRCPNCQGHGIVSYDPSLQSEALVTWCDECKGTGVENVKVLMCDPPSGWKYGFPKPYTIKEEQTVEEWYLEQGYPQRLIDQDCLKHVRFWEQDSNQIDVV